MMVRMVRTVNITVTTDTILRRRADVMLYLLNRGERRLLASSKVLCPPQAKSKASTSG